MSRSRAADLNTLRPRLVDGLRVLSLFGVGFGIPFSVPLVGKLPVSELILLPWFLYLLRRAFREKAWPHPALGSSTLRYLVLALVVSFGAYVVSDLVNGTPFGDLARGWARWGFLGIDLVAMTYLVSKNLRRIGWIAGGYAAGVALDTLVFTDPESWNWKFNVAYPLSYLLPFLLYKRARLWIAVALVALGVVHLNLGTRSLGALCITTGFLAWLPLTRGLLRWMALGGAAVAAVVLVVWVRQGTAVEVREGGEASNSERTAMLEFAMDAFSQSPLLGHGSWFTKSGRLDSFFASKSARMGKADYVSTLESEEIVIHSQLLVTLAEGGFFGGAFFLVYGTLLGITLLQAATRDFTQRVFILLMLLNALWDVAMTPFSGSERLFIAWSGALLVIVRTMFRASERRQHFQRR